MTNDRITTECDCGTVFRVPATAAGKRVKCPNCTSPVAIPGSARPPRRKSAPAQYADEDFSEDLFGDDLLDGRSAAPLRSSQDRPARKKRKAKRWSPTTMVLVFVGGGLFVLFAACAGMAYVGIGKLKDANIYANQSDWGDSSELFPVEQVPVATFRGYRKSRFNTLGPKSVQSYDVTIASAGEPNAGFKMQMRIYKPLGEHAAGSLPCVLVAPAGTNLMVGNALDGGDYHDETLPYAEAGLVAIMYSLDGACDMESATDQQLRKAYLEFRAAAGGVVNGRNALEFVLSELPEVDPNRIYSAGHSSAGTVSLLLAAHEPRISACIAYAPAADVETELAEVLDDPSAGLLLPKLAEFLKQSNPMTHASRFKCPVFLFHARDDQNTPIGATREFSGKLKAAGVEVKFSEVDSGGHYQSMIDAGIPSGIEWLKTVP